MKCQDVQEQMWGYLDEATAEDVAWKHHVQACPECARMWQEMQPFAQTLRELKLERPSAGFADRVMEQVAREPMHQNRPQVSNKWTVWNHLWIASAATFVLALLGGGTIIDDPSELQSIPMYALKVGWTISEIVGKVPNLF